MNPSKYKFGVLASGRGTALQAILDEIEAGKMPGIELRLVVSDVEDAGALEKARASGVNAVFVNPRGKSKAEFEMDLLKVLESEKLDLLCLAGFMRIFGPTFLEGFEKPILNVHPALLPKHGGKGFYGDKVHMAVLETGETESGMTIHFVEEGVDSGPILLQKTVPVDAEETVDSLKAKVQSLEKEWYPEAIRILAGQNR